MLTGRRALRGRDGVRHARGGAARSEIDFGRLPPGAPRRRSAAPAPLPRAQSEEPAARHRRRAHRPRRGPRWACRGACDRPPRHPFAARHSAMRALPWAIAAVALALAATAVLAGPFGSGRRWRYPAPIDRSSPCASPSALGLPLDNRGLDGQTGVARDLPRRAPRSPSSPGPGDETHLYRARSRQREGRRDRGHLRREQPVLLAGRALDRLLFARQAAARSRSTAASRSISPTPSLDRGGAWCPDGSIVFAASVTSGLVRMPPGGGAPVPLTRSGRRPGRAHASLAGGAAAAARRSPSPSDASASPATTRSGDRRGRPRHRQAAAALPWRQHGALHHHRPRAPRP